MRLIEKLAAIQAELQIATDSLSSEIGSALVRIEDPDAYWKHRNELEYDKAVAELKVLKPSFLWQKSDKLQ